MIKEEYITEGNIGSFSEHMLAAIESFEKRYDYKLYKDRIALIVIDMQEFFLNPDAHGFIPSARAIVPNVIRLQNFFRENELPVILTQHINDENDAGMMGVRWQEIITPDHPYADLIEDIRMPEATVIKKAQFDAFHRSALEKELQDKGISQLVITGVMTNLCCETTVRSAFVKGFEPFMPVDATAAYNYQFHLGTFQNLSYGFMQTLSTDQFIEKLGKQ